MSSAKLLLKHSSEILDTYNLSTHGVEEHVESWLKKNKVRRNRIVVISDFVSKFNLSNSSLYLFGSDHMVLTY